MSENQGISALQLDRLAFREIEYTRNIGGLPVNTEYEMNFNREVAAGDDNTHFIVSLTANVWSKSDTSTKLRVTLTGFFRCDSEDEAVKQELIRYNTLAIMFPYLRSQIYMITVQPDIPPVMVPPVNIIAMFKDVDNQEEQSH